MQCKEGLCKVNLFVGNSNYFLKLSQIYLLTYNMKKINLIAVPIELN